MHMHQRQQRENEGFLHVTKHIPFTTKGHYHNKHKEWGRRAMRKQHVEFSKFSPKLLLHKNTALDIVEQSKSIRQF